jgi:hypothetical protein
MGEIRNTYKIFIGKREGKRPFGRRRITIKRILGKSGWKMWLGFIWLRIGSGGGLL